MSIDVDALLADVAATEKDPLLASSMEALNGNAIKTLQDVLHHADSDDVKRKAAVDILNYGKSKAADKPTVTDEQLAYLGRIIVETEEVRLSLSRGEVSPGVTPVAG